LAEMAMGRGPLIRGSFYAYRRRCGKPGCRCARGRLHRGHAFGVSEGGRSRQVPLGGIDAHALAEHVEAYRRLRRVRADMARLFAGLVGTVDRLLRLREIPVGRLRQEPAPSVR
jgi:hypothetical protein